MFLYSKFTTSVTSNIFPLKDGHPTPSRWEEYRTDSQKTEPGRRGNNANDFLLEAVQVDDLRFEPNIVWTFSFS